jgi:phage head maturation protease
LEPEFKKFLIELKDTDAQSGEFTAVIASMNVIDHDGDVTMPGAFPSGKEVAISAFGHGSWEGELPVGKAVLTERKGMAVAEGRFLLDTTGGRDTYYTVKELGDLQEWSYGFMPMEFHFGEQDGQKVRFLDKVEPFEISPVLKGAGQGTRTLSIKSAKDRGTYSEHLETVLESVKSFIERTEERAMFRERDGRGLGAGENRERLEQLMEALAGASSDLKAMLTVTDGGSKPEPESDDERKARHLFAEYQRLRASMNGVPAD